MKKLKVKVTKASLPDYWYADKIGEIFEVEDATDDEWRMYDKDGWGLCIGKEDSEVVDG